MAYSELIKNFNKIRGFLREFYVYGFRGREEFGKSARTYDDERRRIEDYLGDYMRFRYTADGKAVFFAIDSRMIPQNPFFKAFRAGSFTDGDIFLHVYLMSLLADGRSRTAGELIDDVTRIAEEFPEAPVFDESTFRKKLKEYVGLGLLTTEKKGNKVYYSRAPMTALPSADALAFFSEVLPCGVLSYYLLSDMDAPDSVIRYKHHYISAALESEIMEALFSAMGRHHSVELTFSGSRGTIVPLAIYVGTRTGRRYLVGRSGAGLVAKRLDRILSVKEGKPVPRFEKFRAELEREREHVWGASFGRGKRLCPVRFRIRIETGEEYVLARLMRERRCGTVTLLDAHTAEFYAEVYDAGELNPWVRTFLGRIESLDYSDRTSENRFKADFAAMCELYGIGEETV